LARLTPDGPVIHDGCNITDDCDLGPYTEVGLGTRLAHTSFGAYSYCDRYCDIANTTVGKFANIASFVRIGATDHPLDRASLHHFMYRSASYWDDAADDADWFAHRQTRRAEIGHDTWIGHNAQIKPEVTVGHGAVIASGAIVTREVAPFAIVAGIPAKSVRDRLPPAIAERIIALGWWDWDHDALRAALTDFRTLKAEAFLEKYDG